MESQGFDLREEFFGDIQMMKPMWWMRWGITIFLGIFIILFLIGSFVRYPDVIKCEAKVATTIPSITFQVAEDGEIQKVLVENNSRVREMTPLVVLRNTANYNDVLFLDRALDQFSFQDDSLVIFFEKFSAIRLQLGETIDADWASFINEILAFYRIRKLGTIHNQIGFLDDELEGLRNLHQHYRTLSQIDGYQREINEQKHRVDSVLTKEKVLSRVDGFTNTQSYYSKLSELKQNEIQLTRINADITKLSNNRKGLLNSEREDLLNQSIAIKSTMGRLRSSINAWKKRYLFISPIAGQVHFLQNIEEGNISSGKLLTVLPDSASYYVKANIPLAGAGKAKTGQRVLIKLNDFPYKEYGVMEGSLSSFSMIPGDEFYVGKIDIDNASLRAGKIKIKDNMTGIGEIVTHDRSLLERIFSNILYAFYNK